MSDHDHIAGWTRVEMGGSEQGLVVFDGSGLPLHLTDTMTESEVAEYVPQPVARRVLAARLRAWADVLDGIIAGDAE